MIGSLQSLVQQRQRACGLCFGFGMNGRRATRCAKREYSHGRLTRNEVLLGDTKPNKRRLGIGNE